LQVAVHVGVEDGAKTGAFKLLEDCTVPVYRVDGLAIAVWGEEVGIGKDEEGIVAVVQFEDVRLHCVISTVGFECNLVCGNIGVRFEGCFDIGEIVVVLSWFVTHTDEIQVELFGFI